MNLPSAYAPVGSREEHGPLRFLWVDLESDGLDRNRSEILEVGAIGTDAQLNEIFVVDTVVMPSQWAMASLAKSDVPRSMHAKSGLLDDLIEGISTGLLPSHADVDRVIRDAIDANRDKHPVFLAGSGVSHFDTFLIERQMPETHSRLDYAPIDFGGIRRFYEYTRGSSPSSANDSKTHRAIDDIRCSLAEARAYLDLYPGAPLEAAS